MFTIYNVYSIFFAIHLSQFKCVHTVQKLKKYLEYLPKYNIVFVVSTYYSAYYGFQIHGWNNKILELN